MRTTLQPTTMQFVRLALGALLLLSATSPAAAAPEGKARAIGRDDALKLGAEKGPGIATATAAKQGILDATSAAKAPLSLPPHVTLSAGKRFGTIGAGAELGVTAIFDFPTQALGGARLDVATSLSEEQKHDVRRARLDAALRAGVAWSHALEAKTIVALREDAEKQAVAVADIVKKRVGAGVGDPLELALSKGDVGAAAAATLDGEGKLVDALGELRLAIALGPGEPIDPTGDLCASNDALIDESVALADAEANEPSLAIAKARSITAKHEIKLASAQLAPLLGLGASYTRDGFGDHVIAGIVSFPLPLVTPGKFEAGRATIAADVATAEIERVRAELKKSVNIAVHDRKHTREVRDKLKSDALEPLREALRLAKAQLEAGTRDVTIVLLSRQKLVAVEEQYAVSCGEVLRADMRLHRLTGRLVAP